MPTKIKRHRNLGAFSIALVMAIGGSVAITSYAAGPSKKTGQLIITTQGGGERVGIQAPKHGSCRPTNAKSVTFASLAVPKSQPAAYVTITAGKSGSNYGKVHLTCTPGKYKVNTATASKYATVRLKGSGSVNFRGDSAAPHVPETSPQPASAPSSVRTGGAVPQAAPATGGATYQENSRFPASSANNSAPY